MATTKTTEELFSGNNSQTNFPFTIEYLKTSDIVVKVSGVLQTETTDYSVVGTNIVFVTAPPTGTNNIRITRVTDIDTARSIYAAGSSIRAKDLNSNQDQVLFKLQEKETTASTSTISSSSPTSPVNGDTWYDAVSGRIFVYYTDVDSSQWVDASPTLVNSFTPSGANAVTTTASEKLKEIVSVKDFIPVNTDTATTDCTLFIQRAVNYLNTLSTSAPATLVFPAGTYKITAPIDFSQNASGNFRREIVGGNGTMAVAKILVAYHGYGSNLVSGNDKGAFFFGPATGSGNSNEFSLSGFHFKGESGFKHPPAIECKGPAQSRFNNIVIVSIANSGLSISSPQNCKFFNVSVWFSGRSFAYKNTGTVGTTAGIAKVIVDQAQNSNVVDVDATLSTSVVNLTGNTAWDNTVGYTSGQRVHANSKIYEAQATISSGGNAPSHSSGTTDNWLFIETAIQSDTPFTATDKFKTIALWSSSPTNQFRQKCKITGVTDNNTVTVDVTQPNLGSIAALNNKNLIFGSPHITTTSNSTTITADANTFSADDVGAYVWLRVANPTTITAWSASTDYDTVGTLVKNNGRIYRLLADIGTGKLQPTHAKTKKDIDAWAASTAYTTDDLVINAGNIYKAIVDIASGVAAPTHTTPSTNASPGDQDVNGWEYVPWDEMRIGLYRRKITGFTSATQVTLDAPIGATTTTANGTGTENITCEIAVPAIDINSDHGGGNSSDNKFVNLQVESHRGVGVCAEDQSLLDFATTKIHSEQGSDAILSGSTDYSVSALWLHQVDGSYNGSTDGQYIGDNRIYVSAQSAGFILNDFITRTANHEQIIAIDEKNGFFDGSSLIIDNMSITGGIADDGLGDVVNDLSGSPVGYIFTGAFVNQGSDTAGPIIGHITQNAHVEELGTATRMFIANSSSFPAVNPTGGGFLYVESGALKYRGSSGTVTTLGNA